MESNTEKPKKGYGWLWIVLAAVILLICCCIAASALIWVNRTEIPGVSGFFATPTPLPIPGISEPMNVAGTEFIVAQAEYHDSYKSLNQTFTPNKPGQILLVVEGNVITGGSDAIGKWKVEVKDENGESYISGVKITNTKAATGEITFTWLFAVPKDASELTLYLPDGQTIDLMLLLDN